MISSFCLSRFDILHLFVGGLRVFKEHIFCADIADVRVEELVSKVSVSLFLVSTSSACRLIRASFVKITDAPVVSQQSVSGIPSVKIGPIILAILNCSSDGFAAALTSSPVLLHSFLYSATVFLR